MLSKDILLYYSSECEKMLKLQLPCECNQNRLKNKNREAHWTQHQEQEIKLIIVWKINSYLYSLLLEGFWEGDHNMLFAIKRNKGYNIVTLIL